ncbi:MAG: VOC family protein [Dehalococcoidia bacterium]|nr:VOC family protein [Dehalococcoidia bacterium]
MFGQSTTSQHGTPDVWKTVEELETRLGVRAEAGGKHPGRGTHNALLGLGEGCYLEIIGPDPDGDAPEDGERPFGLDRLEEPRLVTWAVRTNELERICERARGMGYDPGEIRDMSRELPDGRTLKWRLTRRKEADDTKGLAPFLIDWGDSPHPSESAPGGCTLVRLRGEHPNALHVVDVLLALDIGYVSMIPGPEAALIAILDTPKGEVHLR